MSATLFLAACFSAAAAEIPADPIGHLRGGHPRLLFTDGDLAAALEAAKADPLRAALHARIAAAAAADLSARPLVHVLKGPRLLDQSRAAIQQILTCAMAYRLTGDSRFAERARRDLLTVAAFPDWNPSHFLDVAEMSLAVAIGYDWLYRELSKEDRAAIREALLAKALAFAPAAYRPTGPLDKRLFFVTARMNWNQVCNGGLLAAALAVADEEPAVARLVVEGVRVSLPLAMDAYRPDGAYPEGPGYWAYGTSYNVIILALLEGALGTDFGLGAAPAFERTAFYRSAVEGPTGLAFNYADGGSRIEGTPAYAWLARRYSDEAALEQSRVELRSEIDQGLDDRFLALYAAWFPGATAGPGASPSARGRDGADSAPALGRIPLCLHFRGGADIALFRSAWNDPRALFLGFKAGDNSTNHAHLDLGSFVLESDGVRWAVDLGPDDYNLPGYFGERRWSYFRLNNFSHNTVTPGEALQDPKAIAPIVAFSDSGARPFAVADLTPAYPKAARRILRAVAMLDRARILVQDEFSALQPGIPVRWVMMTGARIGLSSDGRTALLSRSGRQLRAEVLSPAGARFQVRSAKPPAAAEAQNDEDSVLSLDAAPGDAPADLRLAVLFTPIGDRWPQKPVPEITGIADWH
ncbi:MAG TPA: heparinase II/III family protein [Opitutaceae bacterium]|nr:heparinase II/III family protein [Opitutaceae bacterium]